MRPNILLLVLDTQRADRLSCYGYDKETTPHLDRLAQISTRFDFAIAPSQWTVPTHASIFTGLYPTQHTVTQMESALPETIETLAGRLQQSNYLTAGFSHNPLIGEMPNGLSCGFDHFQNFNYLGAGLLAFHLSESVEKKKHVARLRRKIRYLLAESLGYSQETSLRRFSPFMSPIWKTWLKWRGDTKYAQIRDSLDQAATILKKQTALEKPAFVFVNLMGTHVPYAPPAWATQRHVAPVAGSRSVNSALQMVNRWQVDVSNWLEMPAEVSPSLLSAFYDAEVAAQDAEVGILLDALQQSGALENTIIIVVADHGDHLGEKQRVNHAFGVYNELIRVPLIIHDPFGDFTKGEEVAIPVSTRRIFHTIITMAGIANGGEEALSLRETEQDDAVISEGEPLQWAIQRLEKKRPGLVTDLGYNKATKAILAHGHKLIWRSEERELYDLEQDLSEQNNLDSTNQAISTNLLETLKSTISELEPAAMKATTQTDDETILQHLKALGYLE